MVHDVFISYSSHDKSIADAICAALEEQKIRCWIAPRDMLAGTEYGEALVNAISDCRIFTLIFSSQANESPQVRREVERAVSKGKIIVPFRIENVLPSGAMEYCLSNTHWLDALKPPIEMRIGELAASVRRLIIKRVNVGTSSGIVPKPIRTIPNSSLSDIQANCFNERSKRTGKIQVYHVTSLYRWPYETVESRGRYELTSPIKLDTSVERGTKYRCLSSRLNQSIGWGLLTHNIKCKKDKLGNPLSSAELKLPKDLWIQIDFRLFHSTKKSDDMLISAFRDHVMAEECENPRPTGQIQPTMVKIGSDNDPYFQWFEMGEAPRTETTYVFVSTISYLAYINALSIPAEADFDNVSVSVIHLKKYQAAPTYSKLFEQFDSLNEWFIKCGGQIARR